MKAIEYYHQALSISREIGDRMREGNHLGNLGSLRRPGRATQGDRILRAGIWRSAREIGDRRGEGNALWNMSLALKDQGKMPQAIECAKSALTILESIESPHAQKVKRKLQEWEKLSNQIQ